MEGRKSTLASRTDSLVVLYLPDAIKNRSEQGQQNTLKWPAGSSPLSSPEAPFSETGTTAILLITGTECYLANLQQAPSLQNLHSSTSGWGRRGTFSGVPLFTVTDEPIRAVATKAASAHCLASCFTSFHFQNKAFHSSYRCCFARPSSPKNVNDRNDNLASKLTPN